MEYIVYKTLRTTLKPLFLLLYRAEYIDLKNIPDSGPIILAGNHTKFMDAAIMIGGPKRVIHMMSKKELFKGKVKNRFFRSMACIPVDRSIHDENAKSEAIEILKNGALLGIFPEGTVNKTKEKLLPFKYGAVSFAKKTGALIVPFAITGKYKLFRRSIKIRYGKPYKVTGDLEIENKKLMNKVLTLMKESETDEK